MITLLILDIILMLVILCWNIILYNKVININDNNKYWQEVTNKNINTIFQHLSAIKEYFKIDIKDNVIVKKIK